MKKFSAVTAGLSYDFGAAKLFGHYGDQQRELLNGTEARQRLRGVAATVPVGAAGVVKLSYARSSGQAQATLASLGYQHNLSKRTALYGTFGTLHNQNANAGFTVASDTTLPAVSGPGQRSRGHEVGVLYAF